MNLCFGFVVYILVFISGSTALKCIQCKGDGSSCYEQGHSTACQPVPQGQEGVCGRVNYKANGTNKVENRCALKAFCLGSIDCNRQGFEFGKGKVGVSDCVVSCCETDDCEPKQPLKCHNCKGDGKLCTTNSVSCGYKDDRCLRVNFKVNGKEMVDERCYQASQCSNVTTTCDTIDKGYNSSITECKPVCCEGDNCNGKKDNSHGSILVFYVPLLVLSVICQIWL